MQDGDCGGDLTAESDRCGCDVTADDGESSARCGFAEVSEAAAGAAAPWPAGFGLKAAVVAGEWEVEIGADWQWSFLLSH